MSDDSIKLINLNHFQSSGVVGYIPEGRKYWFKCKFCNSAYPTTGIPDDAIKDLIRGNGENYAYSGFSCPMCNAKIDNWLAIKVSDVNHYE